MPHYSQQQNASLHASTGMRRHLNLLLWDQGVEIDRIYEGTGRLPTYTLNPLHQTLPARAQTAPAAGSLGATRKRFDFDEAAVQPPEFSGVNQPFAQVALRSMRSPTQPDSPQAPWMDRPGSATSAQGISPKQPAHPWQGAALPNITTTQFRKPAPWLMPWQTGDRETGRRFADMVRKRRTPTGAFANLDLAKAAK